MKDQAKMANRRPRVALYARVSTREQDEGLFPSCESQMEELVKYAHGKGWDIAAEIKDPGYSSGTLNRPGLNYLRQLVRSGDVRFVLSTGYDRMAGGRGFYVLDSEFTNNNVDFVTPYEHVDRRTALGRMTEEMLISIKSFSVAQTSEKVKRKLYMRAEKGLYNGGLLPFGYQRNPETQKYVVNPQTASFVQDIFRVYIETASETKVRDWLQAHQILSPTGQKVWSMGSIRHVLMNRRYVGEIEINKKNRGVSDLPEQEMYRSIPDMCEPLISSEVFDKAQRIRHEKRLSSPNRGGKPKSYSRNQCGRVYPLQGRFYCAICGSSMTPYYVQHQPNVKEKRRSVSMVHYYTCSNSHKNRKSACGHTNCISARKAEEAVLSGIWKFALGAETVKSAMTHAIEALDDQLLPVLKRIEQTKQALKEIEGQIDNFINAIGMGSATGPLLARMNDEVATLSVTRDNLKDELHRLSSEVAILQQCPDADALHDILFDFAKLASEAEPEELQQLLRLIFNRIEWLPDGSFWVEIHHIPKSRHDSQESRLEKWFVFNDSSSCPSSRSCEPLFFGLSIDRHGDVLIDNATVHIGHPQIVFEPTGQTFMAP